MSYLDQFKTEDALWTFSTKRFVVEFHATEESDTNPEDSFENPEDVDFARSGNLAHWFCAVVLVRDIGTDRIIGLETLGGCSYDSFREFRSSHRDPDPSNRNTIALKAQHCAICHYFPGMVRDAVQDARYYCLRYQGIHA